MQIFSWLCIFSGALSSSSHGLPDQDGCARSDAITDSTSKVEPNPSSEGIFGDKDSDGWLVAVGWSIIIEVYGSSSYKIL